MIIAVACVGFAIIELLGVAGRASSASDDTVRIVEL
jgi:hypothetical protein